jgi:4-hydroxythreonine-4-phosphate dehydrogenase
MPALPRFALTPGEPAGIGPELTVLLVQQPLSAQVVAVADPELLEQAARSIRKPLKLLRFDPQVRAPNGAHELYYIPQKLAAENEFGFLRRANARYVLACLQRAAAGCIAQEFDALITGPIQKSVINDAGIPFQGHTEYLAAMAGGMPVVMMLVADKLRVALATTHVPLKQVSECISAELLSQHLHIINAEFRERYGLARPRIMVLGLNPHAGEGGHLGREELEVISPCLDSLRAEGLELIGPVSADTAFTPARLAGADVVLAMYHDQGLPVLKALGFGHAVNVTLGLPFVRVSVDHGTALDLAGKGLADSSSMLSAYAEALRLCQHKLAA